MQRPVRKIVLWFALSLLLFYAGDRVTHRFLLKGLEKYFGLNSGAAIVCIGHSHTVLGLDGDRLALELDQPVAKYAFAGANALDRHQMIRQYLDRHPSVHTVLYDVDPRLFDIDHLSKASHTLFWPFLDEPVMADYIGARASWQDYYLKRFVKSARFTDQTLLASLRGHLNRHESRKSEAMRLENFRQYLAREEERKVTVDEESVAAFHETVRLLSSRGIRLILLNIPVVDALNRIDPDNQRKALAIFREAAGQNPLVRYLEHTAAFERRHELYCDLRHLNERGKQEFTAVLIEDLRKILADDPELAAMTARDKKR